MKTIFATITTLLPVFLRGAAAKPVEIQELASRHSSVGVGVVQLCSLGNQCSNVQMPFDGSTACIDLSGDLLFLHHNVANVTFDDVDFFAFSEFGCAGTTLGGDIALGGSLTLDLTNLNGKDVACSISSFQGAFL